MTEAREVKVLRLSLHHRTLGYLAGFPDGRNVLTFSGAFTQDADRPTLSLTTHSAFPRSERILARPWVTRQRLHPVLSNLLPEGSLREFIAQSLKVHIDHEFDLLAWLGADLPGALRVEAMSPHEVPASVLSPHGNMRVARLNRVPAYNRFSLAGVQMKFSVKEHAGGYSLGRDNILGDWIIKPPSVGHRDVPINEYTAMKLAELAGVQIPEIRLVPLDCLDPWPEINLPDEKLAYAIKRFDRNEAGCVHTEDFAQVLFRYPHEKASPEFPIAR